jgi:hypothetical protein
MMNRFPCFDFILQRIDEVLFCEWFVLGKIDLID